MAWHTACSEKWQQRGEKTLFGGWGSLQATAPRSSSTFSVQANSVPSTFHGYRQHRTCGLNKSVGRMQLSRHLDRCSLTLLWGTRFMSSGYTFTR